jgi:hypothetical protein
MTHVAVRRFCATSECCRGRDFALAGRTVDGVLTTGTAATRVQLGRSALAVAITASFPPSAERSAKRCDMSAWPV